MSDATDQLLREALSQHQSGQFAEADHLYREVLAQEPDNVPALHLSGLLAGQFAHFDAALDLFDRAIAAEPNAGPIHADRGNVLVQLGRADAAGAAYRRAIELNPSDFTTHANLADVLCALGRPQEAIAAYRAAIALAPNIPGLHSNLGIILADLKRFDEAIAAHQKAIAIDPNFPAAHANLSQAYSAAGRLAEAIDSARAAATLAPEAAEAHVNLGTTLIQQGRVEEAIEAFRAALARDPKHTQAHDDLLLARHNREHDPIQIFEEHRTWSRQHTSNVKPEVDAIPRRSRRREPIKVAFLSPDFRDHPVGRLFQPFAENHDKNKIELICYADSPITDALTEKLRATSHHWHNTFRLTDAQLAHLIVTHEIDILVDLAGHTAANRLPLFAQVARVQVTWLGYPNTTGLETIDYRITDAIADPPGITDQYHTEKLIRIDPCFLCIKLPFTNLLSGIEPGLATSDFGELSRVVASASTKRPFTFACFNNLTKASPETLELFSKILHAIPNAKLLLKSRGLDDAGTTQYVRDRLTAANIPTDRVELLGHLPQADHLAPYNRADAALDTYPYSGTATTIDALAAGLPVITLTGQTHAARVSTSLLTAAGLYQFIAPDAEAYVKIAQDLAAAGPRTTDQRRALRQKVERSPLCNEKQFTKNLQELFEKIRPT